MNAEILARALGGRKAGTAWMACCPAHQDRDPSLAITDGKDGSVLVRCHAGCDQRDVIEALRARRLWGDGRRHKQGRRRDETRISPTDADSDAVKRTQRALGIWQFSRAAEGTLVTAYLRSRGISVTPPPSIRFHVGLEHPSGGLWPAMVCLVTNGADGMPLGVHRTFLGRDGSGKAPVRPQKMMLGPCRGGAVRLAHPGELLMVGEGIETCLAAMHATGYPAWAALSTSGLRTLDLPHDICEIILLADGDDAGEAAARDAALRWHYEGRRVRIARPPRGLDFNDVLLGRTSPLVENCHVG
jgi:putative DNA primase/helicase